MTQRHTPSLVVYTILHFFQEWQMEKIKIKRYNFLFSMWPNIKKGAPLHNTLEIIIENFVCAENCWRKYVPKCVHTWHVSTVTTWLVSTTIIMCQPLSPLLCQRGSENGIFLDVLMWPGIGKNFFSVYFFLVFLLFFFLHTLIQNSWEDDDESREEMEEFIFFSGDDDNPELCSAWSTHIPSFFRVLKGEKKNL